MFKQVDSKLLPLDKKIAQRFAKMRPSPGEREVKDRRMDHLHRRKVEGAFHTPTWACCKVGGTEYRVNGQHTSKMLLQADDFVPGMEVMVLTFKADTLDDLASLFAQFDSKYSSRNSADIAGAHAGLHEELTDMSGSMVSRICYAIAMAETDCFESCKGARPDDEDRARLIHENVDVAVWLRQILEHPKTSSAGCLAAAYRMWQKDKHYADVFWGHVLKEGHPDPNHATRKLARALHEQMKDKLRKTPPRGYFYQCIKAWNAMRLDRDLKSLRYDRRSAIPLTR